MSALRKLAGQTAIYGLIAQLVLALMVSCSTSQSRDLKGRWRGWLIHGMGERELVFLDDGSFVSTSIDSTGHPTIDIDIGEYLIIGDSLHIRPRDGSPGAFAIQWHGENSLQLVRGTSIIALERYRE
jgi:hypothetical protein